MPRRTGVRIKAGKDFFDFLITDRDWKILHAEDMFLRGASKFIKVLGLYDNFSVKDGTSPESVAVRAWLKFYSGVVDLRNSVEALGELLNYNYSLQPSLFPKVENPKNRFGCCRCFGYDADFSPSKLHACLTMELYKEGADGKQLTVGYIDLRSEKSIQTEQHGEIKILRKKKETDLADVLERLDVFLSEHQGEEITIYHN